MRHVHLGIAAVSFMKIAGEMARDRYAKLYQYIGKRIEITGVSYFPMTGSYQPPRARGCEHFPRQVSDHRQPSDSLG
jgi:hypothetical protein